NRHNIEALPAFAVFLGQTGKHFRNQIELVELDGVPGDYGIGLEAWLSFFPRVVDRLINLLQLAARSVGNDPGPGLVGFTKRDSISVSRSAIVSQSFSRQFSNVWTTHHDQNACGT